VERARRATCGAAANAIESKRDRDVDRAEVTERQDIMAEAELTRAATETIRRLTRDDLLQGGRRDAFIREQLAGSAWSDHQLQESLARTLRRAPKGDVWIFAYGSLIWNPIFPVAEERIARVHGLHRSFCIWSRLGRGSPARPGLVLGLTRGGNCRGVVLRLEQRHVAEELALVWRREMVTGAYKPTWVKARTDEGTVHAIAFVADRLQDSYAGDLSEEDAARIICGGEGFLGTCSDYLSQTTAGLAQRGIPDEALERLATRCGCGVACGASASDQG
jgi:cation transport protein ChaC